MRAATATKPKKIDAYRKEPSVNKKYLPYSYHLNDYVISMENGDLMAFFKLDGRTHDCASDRELVTWHKDLNRGSRSNDVKNHAKRLIHCLY
ncbi:TPA: hypothetical protein ACOZVG_004216 [Yersinia enterocolitica]